MYGRLLGERIGIKEAVIYYYYTYKQLTLKTSFGIYSLDLLLFIYTSWVGNNITPATSLKHHFEPHLHFLHLEPITTHITPSKRVLRTPTYSITSALAPADKDLGKKKKE